jgi:rRNA maturation protein Nop10
MSWAQRLKRVFNIDIKTCPECGGAMKVIACSGNEFQNPP